MDKGGCISNALLLIVKVELHICMYIYGPLTECFLKECLVYFINVKVKLSYIYVYIIIVQ